ncbi:CDP-diacylglycerol--glycerol-3-phosphate 3-phosphatidyltransferase 2 isoform X2 [Selaginella moellendorffii]|uniref:CDP-diacylglycerol--glycerol-3-phosphate 3-phosphatidyltransferase 2 isoform X2 n=1 Tax=Selaginella moellendorffii TaxID=88036 RepID=UPI000D1C3A1F|nr:CDP-diacylglycerol--glycerol-3-phosphate 3-phosphatidyltransferase 2 isoform X2 [Selaginella moellendorffii]|eukprot:XP_024544825.1 CDP-diacylglycerol--glycerol-3-phosphate 3-phosphatidyltransferase 2 isoform X2 [Selaginella moellendorffii]
MALSAAAWRCCRSQFQFLKHYRSSASFRPLLAQPRSKTQHANLPHYLRRFLHRSSDSSMASSHAAGQNGRKVEEEETHGSTTKDLITVPTMLTGARVVAVPALIFVFFSNQEWASVASTGIFVGAALTDWLDGYLARKMKLDSAFGAFLDPVADKLMVATALILLCTRPLAAAWFVDIPWLIPLPAALMISREIIISAVREWAALQGLNKVVAVDKLGKLKTATQMVSLTFLLAFGDARTGMEAYLSGFGVGLLYLSTGLSLVSLSGYMRKLWRSMKLRQKTG